MIDSQVYALLGLTVSTGNFLHHIYSIIRGQTRPHLYSWLIWGLVTAVAAGAQYQAGGGAGAWITCVVTFYCFIRAALAVKYGEKQITGSDKVCLAVCLLAIVIWPLLNNPYLSVLMVTFIDLAGFFPTVRKSVAKPYDESIVTYFLFGLVYAFSMAANSTYNFLTSFYVGTIVLSTWSFCIFLWLRRKQLNGSKYAG